MHPRYVPNVSHALAEVLAAMADSDRPGGPKRRKLQEAQGERGGGGGPM